MNPIREARETRQANSLDDARTLYAAAQGSEAAFRSVYEAHKAAVFRFAYRLTNSKETAEDILQDCFLDVLRQAISFDESRGSLRSYLFGIARHHAFKRLRGAGVEVALEDYESDAAELNGNQAQTSKDASPLQQVLSDELAGIVQTAINRLPPLQREALILFQYEDLSLAQIAQVTETEIGSVKARLFRARENLRRQLAIYKDSSFEIVSAKR